jgi:hypothetical protein
MLAISETNLISRMYGLIILRKKNPYMVVGEIFAKTKYITNLRICFEANKIYKNKLTRFSSLQSKFLN